MFRASSEIAVATTASSVDGNPHCAASSRPFCRAETMSASDSIATRTSSAVSAPFMLPDLPLGASIELLKHFLQVQRRRDTLPGEAPLCLRERDSRLVTHPACLRHTKPKRSHGFP